MKKKRVIPRGYMTVKKIAEETGLSVPRVYAILQKSKIEVFKFGVYVIKRADFRKVFLRPVPAGGKNEK